LSDNNHQGCKILLLEDEPVICRITSRTLTAEGHEVDIAVNGLIAKDKIDTNKYDLLIFDIRTPAMNGIELYEYLAQEHPDLTERVIFSTGDSLGVATKAFLERIGNLYLGKPYTPTELRTIVKQALSKTAV
jgi:two-component system, sensor histidine kinase